TTTAAVTLSTIDLAIFTGTPSAPTQGTATVTLRVNGATPEGTVLESWTFTPGQIPVFPGGLTVTSSVHPLLAAGQSYWLRIDYTVAQAIGYLGWYTATGGGGASSSSGTWGGAATVGVTVNVDPLPAPTVTKTFSPTTIALNGTSTVTIRVTNPNAVA